MKIIVIDGQGGRIGSLLINRISSLSDSHTLIAIGTNSLATSAMLKAGAPMAATGENPVIVACSDADVIIGPVGIISANSLLGEITPAMANAVSGSRAFKILIPMSRCNHYIAGLPEQPLSALIDDAAAKLISYTSLRTESISL